MEALLKEARENEKKIVLRDVPYSMAIETSAYCNLRCVMCENLTMKRKKGNMDFELFKKIADEVGAYPEIKVYLSGYGEPLLNDRIVEYVEYATNVGITQTYMNSNAMLLSEEKALGLIKAGLHCLVVSIDGFSAETYESIRVGGDRNVVYQNVTRYLELLREYGKEDQMVEVQIIEMDKTLPEKELFIEYWTSRGASVKLKPLLEWGGTAGDDAENLNERVACGFCNMFQVMWNGEVPYCACGDYEITMQIGNVKEQSVVELWQKKKESFSKFHLTHEFDRLPSFCQKCPDWSAAIAKHLEAKPKM